MDVPFSGENSTVPYSVHFNHVVLCGTGHLLQNEVFLMRFDIHNTEYYIACFLLLACFVLCFYCIPQINPTWYYHFYVHLIVFPNVVRLYIFIIAIGLPF